MLWPEKPNHSSMDVYLQNNYWNGLSVISYDQESVKIWWVAVKPDNNNIKHCFNDPFYRKKLLISIDYFNKNLELILGEQNLKILPKYDIFDFSLPIDQETVKFEQRQKERRDLIYSYYPKGFLVKSRNGMVKLTNKEVQILDMFSEGYTSKEIAIIHGNQAKTIEHHKEALKIKTGYNLKSDLVKIFNEQISFIIK